MTEREPSATVEGNGMPFPLEPAKRRPLFWYWLWQLVHAAGFGSAALNVAYGHRLGIPPSAMLLSLFAFVIGFIGVMLFRCPRCGERFTAQSRYVRSPIGRCYHCNFPGPVRPRVGAIEVTKGLTTSPPDWVPPLWLKATACALVFIVVSCAGMLVLSR